MPVMAAFEHGYGDLRHARRRDWWDSEENDPRFRGQSCAKCQLTEVFIEGDQETVFDDCPRENISIVRYRPSA